MTSNIDKAIELINTFATGDAEKAAGLLAEGYVQHNLAYGTGRDAFVGSVERLASAPVKTTVQNIRAYQDGDKVFLHTVYDFAGAGEQVAFDVFRFDEDGLICEHWDNLAPKAGPNPSGRTQVDGQVEARDLDATEANRELVRAFLADVMQGEHPDKTPEYFDGDSYLQHNTQIADGLSGLGAALAAMAEQGDGGVSSYFLVYAVVTLVSRPYIGKLIDRYGYRIPAILSALCTGGPGMAASPEGPPSGGAASFGPAPVATAPDCSEAAFSRFRFPRTVSTIDSTSASAVMPVAT